nr:tail fiber protein [Providencia stuartii]ELR5081625.1 tail fiber protein [Providencia stuartii]
MFMLALSGDSYNKSESNNLFANKTVTQLQQFNSIVSGRRTIQAENNSLTFGLYIDPVKGAFLTGMGDDGNHYGELHHPMDGKIGTIARIEDFNTPVGMPIPWPQATAPAGYLICNGQWFNKTAYPLLTKAYPSGQLPDLRGEFIRGLDAGRNIDSGRAVLSAQGDAIRNITGEMSEANDRMINFSGAFYDGGFVGGSSGLSGGRAGHKVRFDASRVVPTANENRPRNIAFLYIVRAA